MAKHDIKPKDETVGKDRMCLSCFYCKAKTFRNREELSKWCDKREYHFRAAWYCNLKCQGEVQLYWCTKHSKGPRILRKCDKPFVKNCKFYDGGG